MNQNFFFTEIIEERDEERLDKFLRRKYPSIRLSALQSFIRSGKVTVDGKRIKNGAERIKKGQRILIKLNGDEDEIMKRYGRLTPTHLPIKMDIEVLYEDDDIVAFNKPSGLSVQPGTKVEKSLYNVLIGKMKEFFFVHRLDKYTSGIIIVAKNYDTAKKLSYMISSRQVDKKYITLVKGLLKEEKEITTPIDDKSAFTRVRPIDFFTGYTLVEAEILTGRRHQIRRHLSLINFPVVGDDLYGDREDNKKFRSTYKLKGYFLHCSEISLTHPNKNSKITIKSPLDKEKNEILTKLRQEGSWKE
ncbi:RluA family pseudouridine synthase [Athalassotoga saccharophila]|uniref:RluA family pseudouridine synthase n=1 Tax=Athalassotoga saccharophila TaxID=1441386 RepID=UPI001379603F|nr:RluA family pseudouridine synthase [Athalassotoga saccharophila]BBJ27660.1 ribosomal large subunit pseudouridine synthase C [Athalassotoga saccharophila]